MKDGNKVFSAPSIEIDPIWKPVIEEMNVYPQIVKKVPHYEDHNV
jgi:hypothetical protein